MHLHPLRKDAPPVPRWWEDEDLAAFQVTYRRPSGALVLFGLRAAGHSAARLRALLMVLDLGDPQPAPEDLTVTGLPVPRRRVPPGIGHGSTP